VAPLVALLAILGLVATIAAQPVEPAPEVKPSVRKKLRKKEETTRISDKLTTKDEVEPTRPGCHRKIHKYKMEAGKTYEIRMNHVGMRDPFLRLEDSDGKQLATDDDSGGNLNSLIYHACTKSGEYRIIATSCSPGDFGDYDLLITPRPPGTVIPGSGGMILNPLAPVEIGDIEVRPLHLLTSNMGGNQDTTHGYVEYRFRVENSSTTDKHEVTLTMPRYSGGPGWGQFIQNMRATVVVDPDSIKVVSLMQPYVRLGSSGVGVTVDGREHSEGIQLNTFVNRGPENHPYGWGAPKAPGFGSILKILCPRPLDMTLQNEAYKTAVGVPPSPAVSSMGSRSGTYVEKGSPHNGKSYMYYMIHQFAGSDVAVSQWSENWLPLGPYDGIVLTGTDFEGSPANVQNAIVRYVEAGGSLTLLGRAKLPPTWAKAETREGLDVHYPGFGACLVQPKGDVTTLSPEAWRVLDESWKKSSRAWNQVTSPTDAHRAFPVVDNVAIPVRGLFIFMFVFVILIGPVNLYWLSRTGRRLWLLWTVPVFSLLTSGLLFVYMAITEGWHGHLRAEAITLLDERTGHATSLGWLGYYSPMTPSSGLRFDRDTELSPHIMNDMSRRGSGRANTPLTINWTDGQLLETGWITAKVPIHFLVRRCDNRRERLPLRKAGADLFAVNGLTADVASLWLADKEGHVYKASDLRAGAEVKLDRTSDKASVPADVLRDGFSDRWLNLMRAAETSPLGLLQPGSYIAVMNDLPFVEPGYTQTQSRKLRSVVYGILKDAP
jgi:hypothetical protein